MTQPTSLDYSQHYARFHPDSPAHRHGLTLFHQRVLAPHLPAVKDAPILDVGCGAGYAMEDIKALGYGQLRGIDVNSALAAQARSRGLDVTVEKSAAAYLVARPESQATILLMDVLEHMSQDDQLELLRAVARGLRPGGRLICSVPNAASAINGYWLYNDYTHQGSFTEDSLTFLLEQTGFGRIECSGPEFFPRPRFLFWLPTKRSVAWWMRCALRLRQRAAYIAELGWDRGRRVVLTPNLLAVADKAG